MINSLSLYIAVRYMRSSYYNRFAMLIQRLSVIAIAVGVAILITISSIFNGFHAEISKSLRTISPHIVITHENFWWSKWEDAVKNVESTKGITKVTPRIRTYGVITGKQNTPPIQIIASVDAHKKQSSQKTQPIDEIADPIIANISDDLQRDLWLEKGDTFGVMTANPGQDEGMQPIALRIEIDNTSSAPASYLDRRSIQTSVTEMAKQMPFAAEHITEIIIDTNDIMQVDKVIKSLKSQFGDELQISNVSEQYTSLISALNMQKKMMVIVLSLVVIIAACNLVTSLVMVVMERKKEIALMQTIGLSKNEILKIFIFQSLLLASTALAIGSVGGIIIARNITAIVTSIEYQMGIKIISNQVFMLDFLPSIVALKDVIYISCATMTLAVISAIYPAYLASNVDPAEVLRYE